MTDARIAALLADLGNAPPASARAGARRPRRGRTLWQRARAMHLPRIGGQVLVAHGAAAAMIATSWALLALAAWHAPFGSEQWLVGCLLAVSCAWILRAWAYGREAILMIGIAGLLRQSVLDRLLATRLAPPLRPRPNAAMEVDAIDPSRLQQATQVVFGAVELIGIGMVLAWHGAGIQLFVLSVHVGLAAWLWRRHLMQRIEWTTARLLLTSQMAVHLSSHRTRAVQLPPEERHSADDTALASYQDNSLCLDTDTARLLGIVPGMYVVTVVATLMFPLAEAASPSIALAVTFGLSLMAGSALHRACRAGLHVALVMTAWRVAAGPPRAEKTPEPEAATGPAGSSTDAAALLVQGVTVAHDTRSRALLRRCSLRVSRGDRILLDGETGSGKSTLAAVLAGLRLPVAGVVLAGGLDRTSLGRDQWCRRVALAPSFHRNHIFADTLARNLLLGRPLPHRASDHEEAWQVCIELGLEAMLRRMPEGLNQMVGDAGWRLSHGETSRVYIARALLQEADLLILDESLAALDPATLRLCLDCVRRRARSLILISQT